MKSFNIIFATVLIAIVFSFGSVFAQEFAPPPSVINYQGKLVDFQGKIVHDTVSITFSIYDVPEWGTPLWTEVHPSVVVWGGVYNVLLGSLDAIPDTAFKEGRERWLGVQIGLNSEMKPRQPLVSVPTALNSDMLDGKHSSQFLCSDRADTMGGCAADIPFLTVINECEGGGVEGRTTNGGNGVKGWGMGGLSYGGYFVSSDYIGLYAEGGGDHEAGYLNGKTTITGQGHVTDITPSTSPNTGALVVKGGVGIGDTLNVAGNIIGSGLKVVGSGHMGPNGEHIAYFENTDGGDEDGIAIKINKNETTPENNFVTFYRGDDSIAGRIEGYKHGWGEATVEHFKEMVPPNIKPWDLIKINWGFKFNLSCFDWGSLPHLEFDCFDMGILPDACFISGWDDGSFPDFDCNPFSWSLPPGFDLNEEQIMGAFNWLFCEAHYNDWKSLTQMDVASLVTFVARMEAESLCKDGGVTYGSHGADYAEWLPKLDPTEEILPGSIVGVHGGKVTLETNGADQIMAISMTPVVLGNMPPDGEEDKYAKVGFVGQVRVIVWGKVKIGDYIIPSGICDGLGIAVSPDDLDVDQAKYVLGKAWSESTNDFVSVINVSVGIKTNEWAAILKKQQEKIEQLESRLESLHTLESRVENLETLLKQGDTELKTTMVIGDKQPK